MKQCLADRGDGEELIDTKLGGAHSTDSRFPSVPPAYDMGTEFQNFERINGRTSTKV